MISINTLKTANGEMLAAMCRMSEKDFSRAVTGGDLQRFASQGADMKMLNGIKSIREVRPDDPRVGVVSDPLTKFWEFVIARLPGTTELLDGQIKPGELRDGSNPEGDPWGGYVFAFGIGWQAIALAAAALIRVDPTGWKAKLEVCLDKVDWKKGPHWNGIAMVGSRVNNTGPGIRATAGYILEQGGVRADLDQLPDRNEVVESLFAVLDNSHHSAKPPTDEASVTESVAA